MQYLLFIIIAKLVFGSIVLIAETCSIICIKIVGSPLWNYSLLHIWSTRRTVYRFMCLWHKSWKFTTYCLLRSFVHELLLLWVHHIRLKLVWLETTRMRNRYFIRSLILLQLSRTWSLEAISGNLLLLAVKDSTLVDLNYPSGFLLQGSYNGSRGRSICPLITYWAKQTIFRRLE